MNSWNALIPSRKKEVLCYLTRALLVDMPVPSGELGEKEFLGEARANALSCADRKVSEHQSNSTIGLGVVKVGEGR
jgi:hypothetical protein